MKNLFTVLFVGFHLFTFSQSINKSYPTFYNCKKNQPPSKKMKEIRDSIQVYISNNLKSDYIKNILKPNDSIEFNYEIIIGEKGHLLYNKTKVRTSLPSFNREISKILNRLPKFTPGIATRTKKPYNFKLNENPEFYVDKNFQLKPIIRNRLKGILHLKTNEIEVLKIQDSLCKIKHTIKHLNGTAYFSTNTENKITNIRIYCKYNKAKSFISESLKNLKKTDNETYSLLKNNNNYSVNFNINNAMVVSLVNKKSAVFPGCKKNTSDSESKKCFDNKISIFFKKRFQKKILKRLDITKPQKILVSFKIDINGYIIYIKAKTKHQQIADETERIIALLPKMQPAIRNHTPSPIDYQLVLEITK